MTADGGVVGGGAVADWFENTWPALPPLAHCVWIVKLSPVAWLIAWSLDITRRW